MLKNVKLIDVTLRESVHVKDANVPDGVAEQLVNRVSRAGTDLIEVGYLAANHHHGHNAEHSPIDYIERLCHALDDNSGTKLSLMLHPELYDLKMAERIIHKSTGLVRLTVSPKNISCASGLVKELKQMGACVSSNLTRMSQLGLHEVINIVGKLVHSGTDYIYVADSNGAMLPEDVYAICSVISRYFDVEVGFHAHDNLGLATANTLAAIEAGASMVDASIHGFGKGPGNLCIEAFAAVLNKINTNGGKYDISELVRAANSFYVDQIERMGSEYHTTKEEGVLAGYYNLDIDKLKELEGRNEEKMLLDELLEYEFNLEGVLR